MSSRALKFRTVHRWVGLVTGVWLLLLGLTGFILDHREWRWLWQPAVGLSVLPDGFVRTVEKRTPKIYQINGANQNEIIAADARGISVSGDGGDSWVRSGFVSRDDQPQVFAVEFDAKNGWDAIWLATDDGIWLSSDGGKLFEPFGLRGEYISALSRGDCETVFLGVADKSRIFRMDTQKTHNVEWVDLLPLPKEQLPQSVDLSRFIHDLHFARGVFGGVGSVVLSDFAGIAMAVLPIGGALYFFLPRYFKRRRESDLAVERGVRYAATRWTYRLHAPSFGLFAAVPILYLCVTGIFIDHGKQLREWMRSVQLDRGYLPPVYRMGSFENEIYGVLGYQNEINRFSIGTRMGLFHTVDGGTTWQREPQIKGFAYNLKRVGDTIFAGGMGSPSYIKKGDGHWRRIEAHLMMPSDMMVLSGGSTVVKNAHGLTDVENVATKHDFSPPRPTHATWFDLIDGLHGGSLIGEWWKWVNDIFAVSAVLLIVTGFVRWIRKSR